MTIETKVNGVDNMIYLSSKSANDGSYTLNVTFEVGTDPDIAAVNVQNRLSQSMAQLPEEITRHGVITKKQLTTTLVLLAVFVPVGFMPGITGQLYKQFAVTISFSVIISSINALTLSPALCATLLKPVSGEPRGFFRWFNTGFDATRRGYERAVSGLVRRTAIVMGVFVLYLGVTWVLYGKVPFGFPPLEDQGNFMVNVPQIFLELDRDKAKTLQIPLDEIFTTLQAQLGSLYVNDFNKFGRTYRVIMQAEQEYRANEQNIGDLYVRNTAGDMVPLRTLVRTEPMLGPETVERYNVYRSVTINGQEAGGFSSGQAIASMQRVADETLPQWFGYDMYAAVHWLREKLTGKRPEAAGAQPSTECLVGPDAG